MASYVDNGNKLDWALPFQRTGNFPIDRSSMFSSYADAVKYAAGNASNPDSRGLQGSSYVGQIITVFENNIVNVYKINADRTLSAIGGGSGGGSNYDVTITSVTTTSDGTVASFSTDSIPILQNQPAFITVNFPDSFDEIPIEPLLFYKEKFDFIEEQNTTVLNKLAYKSMPINILGKDTPADLPNLSLILTFDLDNENPYSSAGLDMSVPTPINTVVVDRIETESDVSMYHFSEDSRAILAAKPGFLNLNVKTSDGDHYKFFYQYATYVNDSSGSHRWLVYKSLPFPGYYIARDGEYIKTLTFDLDNENPYEYAIENDELYNNGSYNTTATINNLGNRIYFTDEAYYQIKNKRPEIVRVDIGTEVSYLVLSGTYDVNGNDTLVYATHTQTGIISVLISHDDTSSTGSIYETTTIGHLTNLTTTAKSSIVAAINEINQGGGGGGTSDYEDLENQPSINSVTLVGDKTSADLGLASQASITDINSKIPNQATSINQLADKDFVNSSISTATASFRGTFDSLTTLQATEGDKNDYAFYSHRDSAGNTVYDRYKYVGPKEVILPDGYTQVERISGNYINTHLVPKLNWHFILTFSSPRLQEYYDEPIFGIRETSTKFEIFKAGYTDQTRANIGSGTVYDSLTNNDVHVVEVKSSGTVYFDGVQKGVLNRGSIEPTAPLYLLAIDRPRQAPNIWTGQSSFYGLKIYDNEENLKMDLVPCIRDQDGSVGVYDLAGTINPDTNSPFYGGATNSSPLSEDKWEYEYSLSNLNLTPAQWSTLNSGLVANVTSNGYDATKTQVLKNINGTLTWVTEE